MKKLWRSINDNAKIFIRTNLRAQILPSGKEDVIKRSYKDFDISKDFELRQKKFSINSIEKKNLTKTLDLNSLDVKELENCLILQSIEEEEEKNIDINQNMIVEGIMKEQLLLSIQLKEILEKSFNDSIIHPKIKENIEMINECLIRNQPINKRLLFETFPELFRQEISFLNEDQRLELPNAESRIVSLYGVNNSYIKHETKKLNKFSIEKQLINMSSYINFLEKEIYKKYSVFLNQAVNDWGWINEFEYIEAIKKKSKDCLTYGEKLIKQAYDEIDSIQKEYDLLSESKKLAEFKQLNFMETFFPISNELKELFSNINEYVKKYKTVRFEDTMFCPIEDKPIADPDQILNDLRKRKDIDIDEIIAKDNEIYQKIIDSGLAIEEINKDEKNIDFINKSMLVTSVIKQLPPVNHSNIPNPGAIPLDHLEEKILGEYPSEDRVHLNELYKVYLLNEEDYKTYNFNYWNKYFNVSPVTLRNIFNYVYFPIPDYEIKDKINRIIQFRDIEYEKRRELLSKMSHEEYEEYLLKTVARPELEETKRLDYLTYIQNAKSPRISERTVVYDPLDSNEILDNQLAFSENMISVDNAINDYSKKLLENVNIIDPDIKRRIEDINNIHRLEEYRRSIIGENKNDPFLFETPLVKEESLIKEIKSDQNQLEEKEINRIK